MHNDTTYILRTMHVMVNDTLSNVNFDLLKLSLFVRS